MKKTFLLLMCLLTTAGVHASQKVVIPELVYQTLKQCYEQQQQRGTELAKCMLKHLEQQPNPDGYKVFLHEDRFQSNPPAKMTLTIVNKFGQRLTCQGRAGEKIQFKQCMLNEGKALTPDQQLSIEPPS